MTGSGFVIVDRDVVGNDGLSVVGSPVTTATVVSQSPDFAFTYNEVTNVFEAKTGSFVPGEGVFVGFNEMDPNVSFIGTPNTGTVTIPLSHQGSGENGADDGFNLVANPFTAAIDRTDFINGNSTLIDGNIWLWSDGGSNTLSGRGGDYIVVNDMGATAVTDADGVAGAHGSYDLTNDAINSVQGFFVLAESTADGDDLTFNADWQITGGNADANFFRNADDREERSIVKLAMAGIGENQGVYNDLIVGLDDGATDGKDFGLDAYKFSGSEFISFYSVNDDKKYAIQALSPPGDEKVEVPLGFYLAREGAYQIRTVSLQLADEGMMVYLVDAVTGNEYDLSTTNEITFFYQKGVSEDRFSLHFRPSRVTTVDDQFANQLSIVSGDQSGLTLHYDPVTARVIIHDLQGRRLFAESIDFSRGDPRVALFLASGQAYILQVDDETIKFKLD
ncbi:MAG: hypothetical protein AAFO69_13780 [Bacteroidota bacterium]